MSSQETKILQDIEKRSVMQSFVACVKDFIQSKELPGRFFLF